MRGVSTQYLLVFIASILAVAFVITALYTQIEQGSSSATTTSSITVKRATNAVRVLSAYTDGRYTYFVLEGFSGKVPITACSVLVDGTVYDGNVLFEKSPNEDKYLDPGDIAIYYIAGSFVGEHNISFVSQSVDNYIGAVDILKKTWKYRRVITIQERSGANLTDFQVRIELNASNFDFTHIQPDCSDLRFTDTSGKLLSYWIERCDTTGKDIVVWVKVPYIPASSETNIYMYYGVAGVLSQSNGPDTFVFFDNFENWSGWIQYGLGVISQSSEYAYDGKYSLKKDKYGDPNGGYKAIPVVLNFPFVLEAHVDRTYLSGANYDRIGVVDTSGNGYGIVVGHTTTPIVGIDIRSSYTGTVAVSSAISSDPVNVWYFVRFIWDNGDMNAIVFDSAGNLLGYVTTTNTTYTTFNDVYVFGGYTYFVDQIRIRKYANPAPLVIVGPEVAGSYVVG